jgi:2,3-bisphosphoglycerate-dependent phosphoglycerate mutase
LRILLALLLALIASPALAAPDTTLVSTVVLVRHAEKNEHPPGGDAGLATKGLLRARELARVLEGARVRAVYASQYGRTRLTAEPLATAIGDSVRTYDANHLDRLAARVRKEGRGETVVIVGHGDTIQPTIEQLIGGVLGANEAAPYDRMWVLTLGPGDAFRIVRLRYGPAAE